MMKKRFIIMFLITALLMIGKTSNAQQSRPGKNLLNDIQIMETVLDKLLNPQRHNFYLFGSNSKGFYLIDYGVIFNVNYSLSINEIISLKLSNQLDLLKGIRNNTYFVKEKTEKKEKFNFKKKIDQLKKSLTHFLGSYASSIRDLKPDERISVIVDFNGGVSGIRRYDYDIPEQLMATVYVRDLKRYRQGKINDKTFAKKIDFKEVLSLDEDISILSNVIMTSLEHVSDKGYFELSGDVKPIRIQGYGTLFFTNVNRASNRVLLKKFYTSDKQSITATSNTYTSEDVEKCRKILEQKLIRSISNYGHTLSTLKQDEWIELAITFKGFLSNDNYSRGIIKVKKKAIDEYYRDKINFNQFMKRVQIIYY